MSRVDKIIRDYRDGRMAFDQAEVGALVLALENSRSDFAALQRALVGKTGLSAIEEAHRLRSLHPL